MSGMIDIYTHVFPPRFSKALGEKSPKLGNIGARMSAVKPLADYDLRFRMMDVAGPGYQQVIALPNPPLEDVASMEDARELAKVGNDAMAELCAKHPDRFLAFVATISMLDIDSALQEIDRAIDQLGARGLQIYTNVAGKPLDLPDYAPIFDAMAKRGLPIWLHPARTSDMTDYASEAKSRYEMWWCFGWPYETSVAMSRLVFSGLFDRHPDLNIITHHCGGMIPYFDGRVGPGLDVLGNRTLDEDYSQVLPSLKRPHLEYFKKFYGDTAMFGSDTGLHAGLRFFGADHVVFSTDAPFAPIAETIASLDALGLSAEDREKITSGNARRLLKL